MRRRAVLLAALLAGAAISAGCGINDPYQDASATSTTSTSTTDPALTATTSTTTTATDELGEPPAALSPTQLDARRRAARAARAFLRGYLPYTYGQRRGSTIQAATRELRRELVRQPPRVSAERRQSARPRVQSLRTVELLRNRIYLIAQVNDGETVYTTTLTLVLRGDEWLVSEVR